MQNTFLKFIFICIFTVQIDCTEVPYFCRSSLKHLPQDIDSWVLALGFDLRQWPASLSNLWLGWMSLRHYYQFCYWFKY